MEKTFLTEEEAEAKRLSRSTLWLLYSMPMETQWGNVPSGEWVFLESERIGKTACAVKRPSGEVAIFW